MSSTVTCPLEGRRWAIFCVLLLGAAVAVTPALAQPHHRDLDDPHAAFDRMMDRMERSLHLSEAQRVEVEPIMREHVDAVLTMRKSYDRHDNPEALQAARTQLRRMQQQVEDKLAGVLDEQQLERFRKFQAERFERNGQRRQQPQQQTARPSRPQI